MIMATNKPNTVYTPERFKPDSISTTAWLEYLMRERQAVIIRLGHLEDVLIEHGRLEYRSIIPRKGRNER